MDRPSPATVIHYPQQQQQQQPSVPSISNQPAAYQQSSYINPSPGFQTGPSVGSFGAGQPTSILPEQIAGPALTQSPQQIATRDLKATRSGAEFALREYLTLQRRRYRTDEPGIEERIRLQAVTAISELRTLRKEISVVAKAAENHRWRKWLLSGIVASFIPAVRAIFRRPSKDEESSNDTEYAFRKSKSLISRILDSVHGISGLASLTFFVFAVLYVFQNEVSLRVARTVSKKLKRLSAKVERGDEEIDEGDMKLLRGWRWRVLLWSQ